MSNGSGNSVFEHVAQQELDRVAHPELSGSLERDGDHLLGQIDAGDLGAIGLGQVERGAADAAAHVEHAHARPQRRAEPGAQVLGGGGAAGADVVLAEDHLVSQDAGAAVLAVVVEFRTARPEPLASLSWDLSNRGSACSIAEDLVLATRNQPAGKRAW